MFADEAHFRADVELRAKHTERLIVIRDNGPAHHGLQIRAYLTTPNLNLRLVALPGYSPDFNPDEAIWDWIREDVTANTCFGTADRVREKVDAFFAALTERTTEVKQRCRKELQALADALAAAASQVCVELNKVRSCQILFAGHGAGWKSLFEW